MSDINYKVRYVNQYDQVVREVPKTGALGDTVSITPNQLGYGFETIVADPKSLELVEDESLNIVEFRVMQTLNNLTVGNHYLDKRLSRTEIKINGYDTRLDKIDMLIDKNQIVDPDTVLWEGNTLTGGSIHFIDVLAPDLSNLKNGVKLELGFRLAYPGPSAILYAFSPLRLWNLSLTMTITKAQMLANEKITITPEIVEDDTKTYQLIKGQKPVSMVGFVAYYNDSVTYPGWIVGGGQSSDPNYPPELSFHYGDDSAFRKFKSNYYLTRVIAY